MCTNLLWSATVQTQSNNGVQMAAASLGTAVREAGQRLGIYASVVQPGCVAVGDAVDMH